ncbi:MAG: hypothetical protein BAJALOKI2v1_140017 [Promethearchaeota archaeon]|nr:MAG: hypothetical protein BAJALOKI2v1_140017 [Candidatus Lokiarchaeota archaeon]
MDNFNGKDINSGFSVIIIGAGLGGLGAACQLTLNGEKVLLLEKNNVPGGFASSFIRGRFEFETALHALSDIGSLENKGSLYKFFEDLGIVPDILTFKPLPEFYRSIYYDGYDITIPLGIEEYTNKLLELFPNEKDGILGFIEMCKSVLAGIKYIESKNGKYSQREILKKHPWLARVAGITLSELFDKFFDNKKLRSLISQPWGYIGIPPERMNAYIFVTMVIFFLNWGAVYPQGRSHALTSAMVKSFEDRGGIIKYNANVKKILTKNNRVCGVELFNGDRYISNAVISNANPLLTAMKMLPENIIPEVYKRKIFAPEIGPSGFSVYLGLNAPYEELGFTAHEHFVNETYDTIEAFESFKNLENPKYMVAACYNHIYENISPPGTSELVLTTLQMGKLWEDIASNEYLSMKDKYADKLIKLLERTISPDIRDYIEVMEIATPLTYYRYSKNIQGAIYGTTQDVTNGPLFRLNSRGAIPGLYQVGAWTNFGGGYSTTILGGRIAAGMYFKDKKEGRW